MTEQICLPATQKSDGHPMDGPISVSRDVLDEMQNWVENCVFNDDEITDISRKTVFGDYTVEREHFREQEDDVSIRDDTHVRVMYVSEFLDL